MASSIRTCLARTAGPTTPRGVHLCMFSSASAAQTPLHELGDKINGGTASSIFPSEITSYINGKYVEKTAACEPFAGINPATGETFTSFVGASASTADDAVAAAVAAQPAWQATPAMERARLLRKAADLLRDRNDSLARLEALDTGRPLCETLYVDIYSAADCLDYMSGVASHLGSEGTTTPLQGLGANSWAYTKRLPLGVCVGIGAWNYPLQGCGWKAAPCLATGNTMVFKPAPDTPLTALALAEAFKDAGVPDGVFNVVLGAGEAGTVLTKHPDVAKVSFTGSVETGKKVAQMAIGDMKKVTMELGGKSPLIIFDDICEIENAVSAAMVANWYSAGEVCSNGTRVFVQDSILDKFLERLIERTAAIQFGDPLDENTQMGSLINAPHLERVKKYVEGAIEEGATVACGYDGKELDLNLSAELRNGFYFPPTILTDVHDEMTVVKEEIFGPVMSILPFSTEEEVLARANNTHFGLAAGVFTDNLTRAHRVVDNLDAGVCYINNYNLAAVEVPWVGFKHSGYGSENGKSCYLNWTREKTVYVDMHTDPEVYKSTFCPYN